MADSCEFRLEPPGTEAYRLGEIGGHAFIQCGRCQCRSFHPQDIAARYCGDCRVFHEDAAALASLSARFDRVERAIASLLDAAAELEAERLHPHATRLLHALEHSGALELAREYRAHTVARELAAQPIDVTLSELGERVL